MRAELYVPRRGPGKASPHPLLLVHPATNEPEPRPRPERSGARRAAKAEQRRAQPRTTRRQLLADLRARGLAATRSWVRRVRREMGQANRRNAARVPARDFTKAL